MNYEKNPWLSTEANKFIDSYVNSDTHILEFGAGGSTIWFSGRTKNLITIEHDREWFNKINAQVDTDIRLLPRPYENVCDEFPEESFDLILVDGRDRIKCIEKAHSKVKPNGILMLDNSERERYNAVFDILKDWKIKKTEENPLWHTYWWRKPNENNDIDTAI